MATEHKLVPKPEGGGGGHTPGVGWICTGCEWRFSYDAPEARALEVWQKDERHLGGPVDRAVTAVEEIRRAAALMRGRAQKAQASPWTWPDIAPLHSAIPEREHIASWHPAVALAVADWLDDVVRAWLPGVTDAGQPQILAFGLDVARAYLGQP